MFVAHLETTTGKTTLGLVDLDPEDMDSAFHALVGMMGQVSDPIVMTSEHVDIFEAPPGTPATLTFKYLGPRSAEFEDQEAFAISMNEHLASGMMRSIRAVLGSSANAPTWTSSIPRSADGTFVRCVGSHKGILHECSMLRP